MEKGYRELQVWKKAMDLVVAVYEAAALFPAAEKYCLTTQLRRAAISIPANIAEGRGRKHEKDYLRFLSIAYGSLMELETLVEIASRLEYLAKKDVKKLLQQAGDLGRMLNGLMNSMARA